MNMTRTQLQALLARNPALSVDETCPDALLPHPIAQRLPARALEPPTPTQAPSLGRISLRITSFRCRLLDYDNLVAGAKSLLDGLAAAGLLPGDDPSQIQTEYLQQKVKHRRAEATVVEILYPEGYELYR